MPEKDRCAFEFAPGVRCQMVAGHEEPYYPYLDRGQYGYYSDILSQGTAHQVLAPALDVPPRDEWTGEERRDSVESWAVFRDADWANRTPVDAHPIEQPTPPTDDVREAAQTFATHIGWSWESLEPIWQRAFTEAARKVLARPRGTVTAPTVEEWAAQMDAERARQIEHGYIDAESAHPRRLRACVEAWPEAESGAYNPACCRFPKSCSATVYGESYVRDEDLEARS
ncbi:hypothetical protein [Microbacterium testaceum]|uniref:hypothetical protein n=1 Tax=Microbacterium testaceum TaxID=2033 RepID=UPI001D17BD19|nr:hypothetical protein [Microbacterium testaceum]